jgi:hypothetical protein
LRLGFRGAKVKPGRPVGRLMPYVHDGSSGGDKEYLVSG